MSTKRTWMVNSLLVTALCLLTTACPGPDVVGPNTPYNPSTATATVEVNNFSVETVYYVYLAPTGSSFWGSDLLGYEVLMQGEVLIIPSVSEGYWDLRVVDASGNYKEYYANYIGAGGYYYIDIDAYDWYSGI